MKVILLKKRSDDVELNRLDPYEQEYSDCVFVPIMDYKNINLDETKHDLLNYHKFDGIVVTSQRAVDAIKSVLPEVSQSVFNKPIYTVGPTTAHRLKKLGFNNVIGDESGNGVALAQLMISDLKTPSNFLFLAGEIHRRNLPDRLEKAGHSVVTRIVYYTEPDANVEENLLKHTSSGDWIVFFSPSHTDRALEFVKNSTTPNVNLAAIGPTTEEFLRQHNLTVSATASDPSAAGLMRAIKEASW